MLKIFRLFAVLSLVIISIQANSLWNFFKSDNTIVGSGTIIEETYNISPFTRFQIAGNFKVLLTQSNEEGLVVKEDDNIFPYIEINSNNGILSIAFKSYKSIQPSQTVEVFVNTKNIEIIDASGDIKIRAPKISAKEFKLKTDGSAEAEINELNTDTAHLNFLGSSKFCANISSKKLNITAAGDAKCKLRGSAKKVIISAEGATNYNGSELFSEEYDIDAAGAAKLSMRVKDKISGSASGAVSIKYFGNPQVKVKTFGICSVKPEH